MQVSASAGSGTTISVYESIELVATTPNGHAYLDEAARQGAAAAMVSHRVDTQPPLPQVVVADTLLGHDAYFHLADLGSYLDTQARASREFGQPAVWARKAILNVARMGTFSSDRTIREYAEGIWGLRRI